MVTWKLRDVFALALGEKLYQEFELFRPDGDSEPISKLPGVSAINMFVGANHSGKSRFLRALARDLGLASIPNADDQRWIKASTTVEEFLSALNIFEKDNPSQRFSSLESFTQEFFQTLKTLLSPYKRGITFGPTSQPGLRRALALTDNLKNTLDRAADTLNAPISQHAYRLKNACKLLEASLPADPFGKAPIIFYIPILRGLRLFDATQANAESPKDFYQQRTQDDYFSGRPQTNLFTGYTLFHRIKDMLLGGQDERRLVRNYERFLSEHFFEDKEVTLTPNKKGVLYVTIGGEEQAIHDVGDGLQSAIILTFEPFMRRDEPCLFFIEEPELFLHPGLQRHILEFFRGCDNHLFFFTTHSNHFLGMSFDYDDISIYNFQRNASASEPEKPRFLVTPVSRGHHSSLELLGVRNSSVFLVNATIWVEGVTDRRYLRKFLELYREHCKSSDVPPEEDIRKLEEDLHYAFVEYGGANLPHWSFLPTNDDQPARTHANERPIEVRTLCAKALVIRDDDETSTSDSKKGKRRQNELLRGELGERILLTPGREIENLLPAPVIAAVVKQKVSNAQPESWTREDYRDQRLGKFLDQKTGEPRAWSGKYGTLKQKSEFCAKAIQHMDALQLTFSDLDEEVQEMVKQICRFLVEQNRFAVVSRRS